MFRPRAITSEVRVLRRAWTESRLMGSLRFPEVLAYANQPRHRKVPAYIFRTFNRVEVPIWGYWFGVLMVSVGVMHIGCVGMGVIELAVPMQMGMGLPRRVEIAVLVA